MSAERPVLSVIIVTWNAKDLIGKCLDHLFANRIGCAFEVIVVDNASKDGTPDVVRTEFPMVRVIAETVNHGFAGGNNIGFAAAHGRYVLLLNPDAFLVQLDTVRLMLAWLNRHRDYAAAGCRLISPDGRHQVGDAGFAPSPASIVAHAFALSGRLFKGIYVRGKGAQSPMPIDVDWLCGAFMLVRRSAIHAVGGLDAGFFLYGEDIEWGCRLRDAGFRLAYLPQWSVLHLQGGTQAAANAAAPSTRWIDGLAAVYARRHPNRLGLFRMAFAAGFRCRAVIYRLKAITSRDEMQGAKAKAMAVYAHHAARCQASSRF